MNHSCVRRPYNMPLVILWRSSIWLVEIDTCTSQCHLTYLLHWAVHLEKLTCFQLVKKFPAFYGNRRFITVVTSARRLVPILSHLNPIPTFHFLKIHLTINPPFKPGSPKWSLSSGFPTKTLYAPVLSHTRHIPRPPHSSRFYHPNNIGWAVQIIKLIIIM